MSSGSEKKTKKRMKGVPAHYNEMKKQHGLWLTDYAWGILKEKAKTEGLSAGECLERILRSFPKETGG